MRNPRVLMAAGVAAVAVAIVVAAVTLPGGGDDSSEPSATTTKTRPRGIVRGQLELEQAKRPDTGAPELLVSLPGPQLNDPTFVRGTPIVWLRCADAAGKRVIRSPYAWPLLEEPGFPPHIHQPAGARMLARIRSCRLTGVGVEFEGRVSGPAPAAQ